MVRRGDDMVVLWPRYFDARRSRAEGRRVPGELAVKDPDAPWILAAAQKAGLEARLEESKRDPFRPWKSTGRVLARPVASKQATIAAVAKRMSESKQ